MSENDVRALAILAIYFAPSISAAVQAIVFGRKGSGVVLIVNLLFGWTVIGWFIALYGAIVGFEKPSQKPVQRPAPQKTVQRPAPQKSVKKVRAWEEIPSEERRRITREWDRATQQGIEKLKRTYQESVKASKKRLNRAKEVRARQRAGIDDFAKTMESQWFLVTRVIDGDTIHVQGENRSISIRLMGIDAPETVHPSRPVEPFARVASTMATELMLGKRVLLEQDNSQGAIDKYDRILAYVWLENGTLVNDWLVRNGYAREQMYYDNPCKYRDRLLAAEAESRQAQRGMWAN